MRYSRNLPHIQNWEKPLYITICTHDRWVLPDSVRPLVLKHCLYEHGRKLWLHSIVVMPDHVHLILSVYRDADGTPFGLPEIMNGIKGASAHSINKALNRKGTVWQDESFDHVLRSSESVSAKGEYIWNNPVRKGLVKSPEQWPWFWGDWMDIPEGCAPYVAQPSAGSSSSVQPQKHTAEGGGATRPVAQPPPAGSSSSVQPQKNTAEGGGATCSPPSAAPQAAAQPRAAVLQLFFRHLWGKDKRAQLLATADANDKDLYTPLNPPAKLGYPFMPGLVASGYLGWPILPELFPTSFPGVKTSRDEVVVDIDKAVLTERITTYFDKSLANDLIARMIPRAMETTGRFKAAEARELLLRRGFLPEKIVPYSFRPFDLRFLYWEPETKLLDEKRTEYVQQVCPGNLWLSAGQRNRKEDFYQPQFTTAVADLHLVESNVALFPLFVYGAAEKAGLFHQATTGPKLNLSEAAASYLSGFANANVEATAECLFYHILAVLHAPAYREENAGALRQDWPRIPLPATREALEASAALGRQLAALLDVQQQVKGVTTGTPRPELKTIGVITCAGGGQIDDANDLAVTAGWANAGRGGITMPASGDSRQRDFAPDEAATPRELGPATFDIHLNDKVYWKNVPQAVWEYTLGGYQVLKKWLSYREHKLLGRPLRTDEARYVTEMTRRIAAILLMQKQLDENYRNVAGQP